MIDSSADIGTVGHRTGSESQIVTLGVSYWSFVGVLHAKRGRST
jgi:hypothetical protein